jgi:hypothetical protein
MRDLYCPHFQQLRLKLAKTGFLWELQPGMPTLPISLWSRRYAIHRTSALIRQRLPMK